MTVPRFHVGFPLLLVFREGPEVPFQPREAELRVVIVQFKLADALGLLASAVVVFDLHLGGSKCAALLGHMNRIKWLGFRGTWCKQEILLVASVQNREGYLVGAGSAQMSEGTMSTKCYWCGTCLARLWAGWW